jgi:hypothetical protein
VQNVVLDHVDITSTKNSWQIIHADGVKFVDSKVVSTAGTPGQVVDSTVEGLAGQ